MIRLTTPLLMAALSLLSVLSAQAANMTISYLPFAITAPGTYVVTKNLSFSSPNSAAITISTALSGPVVLDLKGFTLTGGGYNNINAGIGIGILPGAHSDRYKRSGYHLYLSPDFFTRELANLTSC